jgi:hypothetical protein
MRIRRTLVMKFKHTILISSLAVAGTTGLQAQSLQVTIESGQGFVTDAVRIPVKVDDAAGLVGAALLVTYDTEELDLEVTSTFFEPIIIQLEEAGAFVNGDPFVDIDIVADGSAIQTALIPGTGTSILASRILPADGSNHTLFELYVSRKDPQGIGVFDINIEAVTLSNENAGYPPEGQEVDLLVGFVGEDIIARLSPDDLPAAVDPGTAEFLASLVDDDLDNLPDPWELSFVTDIDQLGPGSDFDMDGLDDMLEYFLGLNPIVADDPSVLALEIGESDTDFSLSFPMRNDHSIPFLLEWTTDAVVWNTHNVIFTDRPDLGTGPDWTLIEAAFSVDANPDGTVLARLRLENE